MDVVKLLTRSTNLSKKVSKGKDASAIKLPSAGSAVNPQLFHDEVPELRGKKRKRNDVRVEQSEDAEVEDEEIDFFASRSSASKPKKSGTRDRSQSAKIETTQDSPSLLDEDECRQTLRSHRLKATLLPPIDPPKKAKKAKKRKESREETSKIEPRPLYPQPLVEFRHLQSTYGIAMRLGENLRQQGYKLPTEVQMGSLPLQLRPAMALGTAAQVVGISGSSGNPNLLVVAPTGSGKTLAFLIPAVNEIYQQRRLATEKERTIHSLQAIVVAPTKELASQIVSEAKKLSVGMGIRVVGMKKGMRIVETGEEAKEGGGENSESEKDEHEDSENDTSDEDGGEVQKKMLRPPVTKADILVTTPLILLHALEKATSTEHHPLPTVRTLILDEADVLLDPLFREQTLGIWNACTSPELKVTLWSATMGANIESLTTTQISARHQKLQSTSPTPNTVRLVVGLKDSALPTISHRLIYCATEPGKLLALRQLLHPTARSTSTDTALQSLRPPFLVFTQTISRAMALHSELLYDIPLSAGGSSRLAVLHSSLSDSARSDIMKRFRLGEIWILITTDILSRGIDWRGLNGVVNYDVPNSAASYVHRVGRTGRAGREGGVAVTLYTKDDIPFVRAIATVIAASERAAGVKEEDSTVKNWLLESLPKPSKEMKKKVKLHGIESRRTVTGKEKDDKGKKAATISTKSGYERKLEHRRRGAIEGSRRRKEQAGDEDGSDGNRSEEEWSGIE
ncbi:P-loop containing nucleoside triphosphate hydrolase protein [Xylogone sp. PMI_703]|nr:P-loop containing nucleoside triphosphate hydrolase protein [Xylogone sp. PMI_703]